MATDKRIVLDAIHAISSSVDGANGNPAALLDKAVSESPTAVLAAVDDIFSYSAGTFGPYNTHSTIVAQVFAANLVQQCVQQLVSDGVRDNSAHNILCSYSLKHEYLLEKILEYVPIANRASVDEQDQRHVILHSLFRSICMLCCIHDNTVTSLAYVLQKIHTSCIVHEGKRNDTCFDSENFPDQGGIPDDTKLFEREIVLSAMLFEAFPSVISLVSTAESTMIISHRARKVAISVFEWLTSTCASLAERRRRNGLTGRFSINNLDDIGIFNHLFTCMNVWLTVESVNQFILTNTSAGEKDVIDINDIASHPLISTAIRIVFIEDSCRQLDDSQDTCNVWHQSWACCEAASELLIDLLDKFPDIIYSNAWQGLNSRAFHDEDSEPATSHEKHVLSNLFNCSPSRIMGEIVFKLADTVQLGREQSQRTTCHHSIQILVLKLVAHAVAWKEGLGENGQKCDHQRANTSPHALAPLVGFASIYETFASIKNYAQAEANSSSISMLIEWIPDVIKHLKSICQKIEADGDLSEDKDDSAVQQFRATSIDVLNNVISFLSNENVNNKNCNSFQILRSVFGTIGDGIGTTLRLLESGTNFLDIPYDILAKVDVSLFMLLNVSEEVQYNINNANDIFAIEIWSTVGQIIDGVCQLGLNEKLNQTVLFGLQNRYTGVACLVYQVLHSFSNLRMRDNHAKNAELAAKILTSCLLYIWIAADNTKFSDPIRFTFQTTDDALNAIGKVVDTMILSYSNNNAHADVERWTLRPILNLLSEINATILRTLGSVLIQRNTLLFVSTHVFQAQQRLCSCMYNLSTIALTCGSTVSKDSFNIGHFFHSTLLQDFTVSLEHLSQEKWLQDGTEYEKARCLLSFTKIQSLLESPLMIPSNGSTTFHHTFQEEIIRNVLIHPFRLWRSLLSNVLRQQRLESDGESYPDTLRYADTMICIITRIIVHCSENFENMMCESEGTSRILETLASYCSIAGPEGTFWPHYSQFDILASMLRMRNQSDTSAFDLAINVINGVSRDILASGLTRIQSNSHAWKLSYVELIKATFTHLERIDDNGPEFFEKERGVEFVQNSVQSLMTMMWSSLDHATHDGHTNYRTSKEGNGRQISILIIKVMIYVMDSESLWGKTQRKNFMQNNCVDLMALKDWLGYYIVRNIIALLLKRLATFHSLSNNYARIDVQFAYKTADLLVSIFHCTSRDVPNNKLMHWIQQSFHENGVLTVNNQFEYHRRTNSDCAERQICVRLDDWLRALSDNRDQSDNNLARCTAMKTHKLRESDDDEYFFNLIATMQNPDTETS